MENIPCIHHEDGNLVDRLSVAFLAITGSSAYSNSRDRPYNGQPWTDHGDRGKTEVKGLTMRDVVDCMAQAFLRCADPDVPEQLALAHSTAEINKEFIGTEYENTNTWRYDDIYKVDLSKVDPGALIQNALCFIEHYMGIFPNVDKLKCTEITNKIFTEEREML